MNRFEKELGRYFLAWLPFAGPDPGEVFEEFGMSRSRAAELLLTLIGPPSTSRISASATDPDEQLIVRLANHRDQIRKMVVGSER